ncbi:MAG: endonuclease/exonuclease/phosphatase family protein [Luteolibacter sp.]
MTGSAYSGRISAYVSDPGDVLSFEKISGPSWLVVSADGGLTGTPAATDAGLARFTLRARDLAGHTADAMLEIEVFPPGGEHVGQLKIMSYNTLLRWETINDGFRKGIESIVLADADVACLQESGGDKARRAAEALGWFYVPPGNGWAQMISRYPVVGALPGGGGGQGGRLRLANDPLREVVVYNCYLSANYSALAAAAVNGATAESALAEEMRSPRPDNVNTLLQVMAPVLADADHVPVFLTGDFNSSSHLDWTAATAARHNGIGHVEWPCSLAVAAAGMKDSFRVKYPDPVAVPGLSWTPLLRDFEVKDRIDFIYYKGAAVSVMASDLFHTAIETTVGKGQSINVAADNTWPSDHAAMITCFRLEPVDTDGDGMSDAWEKRWFNQLAMSGQPAPGQGLDLRWRMMLGGDPKQAVDTSGGLGVHPVSPGRCTVSFPVSEFAYGHGLALEASRDLGVLDPWEVLWSYDEDPQLQSPGLVASRETTDQWRIVFEPVNSPGTTFYRLRRTD